MKLLAVALAIGMILITIAAAVSATTPVMQNASFNNGAASVHWTEGLNATCLATDADGDYLYYQYNITKDSSQYHSFWDDGYVQEYPISFRRMSGSFFEYNNSYYFLAGRTATTPTEIRQYQLDNGTVSGGGTVDLRTGLTSGTSLFNPVKVVNDNGTLRAVQYTYSGQNFSGYSWNGTSWVYNSTFTGTLTFTKNIPDGFGLFMLDGEIYVMYGLSAVYRWNGTDWVADLSAVSGLTYGADDVSTFEYDNTTYTIRQRSISGGYELYLKQWNGSTWQTAGVATYLWNGAGHDLISTTSYLLHDWRWNTYVPYEFWAFGSFKGRVYAYNSGTSSRSGFYTAPSNNDMYAENVTAETYTESIATPGTYELICKATDLDTFSSTLNATINVTNTQPQVDNVTIVPQQPTLDDQLNVTYDYEDADGDLLNNTYIQWYENGQPLVGQTNETLDAGIWQGGTTITAEVIVFDGMENSTSQNDTVQGTDIINVTLSPSDIAFVGQQINASYDINGTDDIVRRWYEGGELVTVQGASALVNEADFSRSDCVGFRFQTLSSQTYIKGITVQGRANAGITVEGYFRDSTCGISGSVPNVSECAVDALSVVDDVGWNNTYAERYAEFDVSVDASTYYYVYYCPTVSSSVTMRRSLANNDASAAMLSGAYVWPTYDPYFITSAPYEELNYSPQIEGVDILFSAYTPSGNETQNASVYVNTRPVAENLTVLPAVPLPGQTITASYDFYDADGHAENGTTIQWYGDGSLIAGANTTVLAGNEWVAGIENITVVITPNDGYEEGSAINDTVYPDNTPILSNVSCPTLTYPNENDEPSIEQLPISFSVLDLAESFSNINIVALLDAWTSSCTYTQVNTTARDYVCNVSIHYWYEPGTYDVNITASNSYGTKEDTSESCSIGALIAFQRTTDTVSFSEAAPGISNVQADNPIAVQNTGNVDIELFLTAYDVTGRQYPSDILEADKFKAGASLGSSVQLEHAVQKNISMILSADENAEDDVWLYLSMPSTQRIQDYYTTTSWQLVGVQI